MNATLMIRLIEANRKAGRMVRMVDNFAPRLPALAKLSPTMAMAEAIQGPVFTEPGNTLYKLNIGGRRYYVNDMLNFINKGSLKLVVDK